MSERYDVTIDGETFHNVTSEIESALRRRSAFVDAYCSQRGWDKSDLTWAQIFEIRAQDGWKSVGVDGQLVSFLDLRGYGRDGETGQTRRP